MKSRKEFLTKSALGIASYFAMAERANILIKEGSEESLSLAAELIEALQVNGEQLTIVSIGRLAVDFIFEEKLGWLERNKLFSNIYFFQINDFGMQRQIAQQNVELVQSIYKNRVK